jgi:hypothetical protein
MLARARNARTNEHGAPVAPETIHLEANGQAPASERIRPIHDVKMEMRLRAHPGIPALGDHLTPRHAIAPSHANRSPLEMREQAEFPLAVIEDNVVPEELTGIRDFRMHEPRTRRCRRAIRLPIHSAHDDSIGRGQDLSTEGREISELRRRRRSLLRLWATHRCSPRCRVRCAAISPPALIDEIVSEGLRIGLLAMPFENIMPAPYAPYAGERKREPRLRLVPHQPDAIRLLEKSLPHAEEEHVLDALGRALGAMSCMISRLYGPFRW